MSLLGAAEAAATAGTPWGWIRLGLRALPYVTIAGLLIALLFTRGQLDHARMRAKVDTKDAQLASAKDDLEQAGRTSAAVQTYADRTAALQPIVVRSTYTVTRYAALPALPLTGCLGSTSSTKPSFLPPPAAALLPSKPTRAHRQADRSGTAADQKATLRHGGFDRRACEDRRRLLAEAWPS